MNALHEKAQGGFQRYLVLVGSYVPTIPATQGSALQRPCLFRVAQPSNDQIITARFSHLHVNMRKFLRRIKSKKTPKPSTNLLLGIPTGIAVGPAGFRASLDTNSEGKTERFLSQAVEIDLIYCDSR